MMIKRCAKFSDDGKYRFWLQRLWDKTKQVCVFIMLNPSFADHEKDDPTILKCKNYARGWKNFGSLEVINLFAFISTDRKKIRKGGKKIIGKNNDDWILRICKEADLVVAAWGNDGKTQNRSTEIEKLLRENGIKTKALKINKSGEPHHPLYLKKGLPLKSLKDFAF